MQISGHETRSMFDRYNVVSEADLADAAHRIEQGATQSKIEFEYNSGMTPSQYSNESHLSN